MPYSVVQRHETSNGLLMRNGLHRLVDEGYMTIDPADRRIVVSRRIRRSSITAKTTTSSRVNWCGSRISHGLVRVLRILNFMPVASFSDFRDSVP
jgi:hypothetical protein